MNTGVISSRYARALLKYTLQTGRGEQVFAQVRHILKDPDAVSTMELEDDLQRFIALLDRKGRMEYVRLAFSSFVRMYCDAAGIRIVHLKTAVPSPALEVKLGEELSRMTGCRILMDTEVDPDLIGGFVFEISGRRLDASVRHRLDSIGRQFTETNRRIV
ncbi:MAG: F0F1 ATP synthase subunit delta [Bacteroidales bacterium]|nr:F0F1 ATP synthase subunit delta [Bacteroidales bacterium]MBR1870069.1 F0F1 ATP synthase subunit delta [Bacteroidales bacterium]